MFELEEYIETLCNADLASKNGVAHAIRREVPLQDLMRAFALNPF